MHTLDTASSNALQQPSFFEELHTQRWDDHRLYHHSRVNQSLHLISACSFLCVYAMLPFYPAYAAIIGWILPMWIRQIGHFFFEPRGFDTVNNATFEHKEDIKVGFNLRRKIILLTAWAALPLWLWFDSTLGGILPATTDTNAWIDRLGIAWLWLAVVGLLARGLWLMVTRNPQHGLVWMTKILTDPFHDIKMYHAAPLYLLKGEWIDPMTHVRGH